MIIAWLLGFFIFTFLVLSGVLIYFIIVYKRSKHRVTALIINDDGSTIVRKFDSAPKTFDIGKARYVYDERAVFNFHGRKTLVYRAGVVEPVRIHSIKNPRPLSSEEYQSLIKAEVHKELFGSSELPLIKIVSIITMIAGTISVVLLLFVLFRSPPDTMMLSGDNATRAIIEESVRRAIGR